MLCVHVHCVCIITSTYSVIGFIYYKYIITSKISKSTCMFVRSCVRFATDLVINFCHDGSCCLGPLLDNIG